MKKNRCLFILIASLALVGCSKEKNLECEKTTSFAEGNYSEKVILTYQDKNINYYKSIVTFTANSGSYLEEVKDIYLTDEPSYNKSGLKSSYKVEGNKITITLEGSAEDIKAAAINNNEEALIKIDKTVEEYRKYIEKDSALERRFSPIQVEEPTEAETIEILKGIRDKYEAHHNVKITDDAIKSAVTLSKRYIADRFLPDKAIDLIDEASSKIRIKKYIEPDEIKKLQEELEKIEKDKEDAIYNQEFENAAKLRDKEREVKIKLSQSSSEWEKYKIRDVVEVKEENIAEVISKWTGIPVQRLNEDDNEKIKNLEKNLHKRVIGQNEAVEAVAKAIRRGRIGLKDPKRPIGSFLFLGPTGVGKTELCKALAENLFDNEDNMIRLDMSEYMEPHSVSKIIGAPPGYVGFDDGGQLTEKVKRKPYSLILFDEVEKAHPDVMNLLLQILEDGRLTDTQGREVDFKNAIIIMTSNIGARYITDRKNLGFGSGEKREYDESKNEIIKELKKEFRPELINRIDEIIVFHKLENREIIDIAKIMLKQIEKRLEEKKYLVKIDDSVAEIIANSEIDKNYGARPLRRKIQELVEDRLSEEILQENIVRGKEFIFKL